MNHDCRVSPRVAPAFKLAFKTRHVSRVCNNYFSSARFPFSKAVCPLFSISFIYFAFAGAYFALGGAIFVTNAAVHVQRKKSWRMKERMHLGKTATVSTVNGQPEPSVSVSEKLLNLQRELFCILASVVLGRI